MHHACIRCGSFANVECTMMYLLSCQLISSSIEWTSGRQKEAFPATQHKQAGGCMSRRAGHMFIAHEHTVHMSMLRVSMSYHAHDEVALDASLQGRIGVTPSRVGFFNVLSCICSSYQESQLLLFRIGGRPSGLTDWCFCAWS
jgi:hypothetical protein